LPAEAITWKEDVMLKEFKEFALRGNVIDMAVGILIGGAFGTIVGSLVKDMMMPPIGLLVGGMDFSSLFVSLSGASYPSLAAAEAAGAPVLRYGVFLNTVLNFVIIAAALFMVVKGMNRLRRPTLAPSAPSTKSCPECLSEIPRAATRCAHCAITIASAPQAGRG
jgi:large conductance mechanosensitive channel